MAWTKEQEEAIYTSGNNIIVSAGAGSGKTAVLTERVLEKVKNGISLSNLLVLTFTRMAASEMKERIGSKLKEAGLKEELSKLDAADITTFDAYALSLVKKYHYYLNVNKDINVIEDSVIEIYKSDSLTEIFDELYEKEDKEFLSLIKEYCLKNDHDIYNFILNINKKLDLKTNKREYLESYIDNYFNDEHLDIYIDVYVKEITKRIDLIRDYLEYIDDSNYLDKLISMINPLLKSKTYDEIKNNIPGSLPQARNVSDITKEYKEKISNLISDIKDLTIYDNYEYIKNSIIKTKPYVKTIIDILLELDNRINNYKKKYDYYEYVDIALMAIKLVKENDIIREEIKNNLNEILIDEYQDTNDIQEEFISYIANNNVYMVGDIKQSIYRFRNANPYIFKNKYDLYSNNNGGIKIDLNKNFRSREEVINNINLIFNKIMDDDIGGASYCKSHQMIYGNPMYQGDGNNNQNNDLEIYSYLNDTNYRKEEVEAFIIANDINKKIKDGYLAFDKDKKSNNKIKYSDIVILMSDSKNFELYKKILEYNNIPTTILKNDNLIDGEVITIIKNIISLILKIKNNEIDIEFKKLFMSIGRSFLFEIDDDTLFSYFLNNDFSDSKIYNITKEISDVIDSISLNELIDLIITKYDFYNKLILIGNVKENIIRIDKLKEIINNLTDLDYDIYKFKDYLNKITENKLKIEYKINESSSNTVKIMTIHASKGLEFGICYFPGLYSKFNIKEVTDKYTYDDKYGIVMPYKDNFICNTIFHTLSYKDYVKENISEKIRLFYVALTRAKEKMIFILPQNKMDNDNVITDIVDNDIRNKYISFASILYSIEPIIKKYYKNIELDKINLTKNYNLIKNNNYKKMIKSSNIILDVKEIEPVKELLEDKSFFKDNLHIISSEEQNALDYGTKMHELLECIDFNNINYDILNSKEKDVINNFINKIDINNCHIYKEYEFIYEEDNTTYHGIIDLMLEYDNNIKIIDYKLKNISDEAYIKQLIGYKNYIEKLFNKNTSIYLYSIIENELKEIIP